MTEQFEYGGFWRRLGAFLVDTIIMLPYMALVGYLDIKFRLFSVIYFLPGLAVALWYNVYLVKRYGGTPGKLVAGLSIRRLDGTPVGYREALLRNIVEFTLAIASGMAMLAVTLALTDEQFRAMSFELYARYATDSMPRWYKPVQYFSQAWVWGEFIVILTNHRRRAIHDFIAGTIVIVKKPGA